MAIEQDTARSGSPYTPKTVLIDNTNPHQEIRLRGAADGVLWIEIWRCAEIVHLGAVDRVIQRLTEML